MTATTPVFTTWTNLGPMITPMSFPTNCLSSLYDFNTPGLGLPWTYRTQGCALSTCCPSGSYYSQAYAWMTSYYSPAVCPVAYQTCELPSPFTTFTSVSGESIALCCPYDYQCPGNSLHGAYGSLLSTATSVVVLDNIYDQSIVSTRVFTPTMQFGEYQIAYPIQIRWKAGDWESKTGTITATTQPTQTSGPLATSSATSALALSATSSKLSTGSLVGIITGSISASAAILGLAFKVYKWKYPKKQLSGTRA